MEFRVLGSGDAFGSGGRSHTCFLVTAGAARALVDCGASVLASLHGAGVEASAIDAVFLTHLHGDHFGGVPFLLLDAVVGSGRDRPLIVAGPRGVERVVLDTLDLLYPGMAAKVRHRRFVSFAEWSAREPLRVGAWAVTPIPVVHAAALDCYGLRVSVGGHLVACSGDTEWTDALLELASGADLLACECSTFGRAVAHHLSFEVLREHLPSLGARRILLTHMGPDMLGRVAEVEAFARERRIDLSCAYDGLVVALR